MQEQDRSPLGTLRSDLPELLKGVPVLSSLSDELRNAVAERATIVTLPAGEWLFHQGDAGDVMFLVLSGRVEVVLEQSGNELVRVLGRGGVVGELAILTEAPRSAGVRARRDAELLALDRSRFAELLTEEASFTMSLTREIGMQLRASRALEAPASSVPATIALVPLVEERRFEEVREGLRAALERCASIAELDRSDDPHAYGPMLDRAEREATRVLLPTGNPGVADEWTAFCLRQSDRTVVVADDAGLPSPPPASLRGADVLLLASGERAAKPVPLVEALSPGSVHVVRPGADFHRDLARAARRLSGSSVGVVLSGGGARGFCHIGVLRELLDAGLEIDRVGGCSMGAYSAGCSRWRWTRLMRDRATRSSSLGDE